jgi:multidrug efflux pump subunit AcrB
MTFPLNRMVGRDFVPAEDMGEWTLHMDAPEGTSLEGTEELAFRVLKICRALAACAKSSRS